MELAGISSTDEKLTATRNSWNRILLSRIHRHRGEYEKAIRLATEVVSESGDNQRAWKAAALIALGEAIRERALSEGANRWDDSLTAEAKFKMALDLVSPHSLNVASCLLHMTMCAVVRNDQKAGQQHMRAWQEYSRTRSLENGYLRDLETDLKTRYQDTMRSDFVLEAHDFNAFTWDQLTDQLRFWLVRQWEEQPGGLEAAAAQLKISRATIYNWKRERDEVNSTSSGRNSKTSDT
jgi:hypothetical protein